jgi:hypothetical protein
VSGLPGLVQQIKHCFDLLAGERRSGEAKNDMRLVPPATMPPAAPRPDWVFDEPADEFGEYYEAMPVRLQPDVVEREEGLLTNRAFDALDEMGDWMPGRGYGSEGGSTICHWRSVSCPD